MQNFQDYLYIKTNIWRDFQIYISALLEITFKRLERILTEAYNIVEKRVKL